MRSQFITLKIQNSNFKTENEEAGRDEMYIVSHSKEDKAMICILSSCQLPYTIQLFILSAVIRIYISVSTGQAEI